MGKKSLAIIDSYVVILTLSCFQKKKKTCNFRNSNLKIIDMTDEMSKANYKTSSHALTSVAIAVGKHFKDLLV